MKLQHLAKSLLEYNDPIFNHEDPLNMKKQYAEDKKINLINIDGETTLTAEEINNAIDIYYKIKRKIISGLG